MKTVFYPSAHRRHTFETQGKGAFQSVQDRWLDLCEGACLSRAVLTEGRTLLCCHAELAVGRHLLVACDMHLRRMLCYAQSFAIFGGVYAFASCMVQRIRDKQDGEQPDWAPCSVLACH